MRKTVLWVGDAACPTGFARSTHEICDTLNITHDVVILGINHQGDSIPGQYPYPIYSCIPGGDLFGTGRLVWLADRVKPDLIVLQNDGWNMQPYIQQLRRRKADGSFSWPKIANVPVVAIVAVDGHNFQGQWLDGIAHTVFWTQWALDEARAGGYAGPATVIPLGVNREIFKPMDKQEMRRKWIGSELANKFIIGAVNRNQPRKRWDLLLKYFAEWIHDGKPLPLRHDDKTIKIKDAYLLLHVAPTGDMGIDIRQLSRYFAIESRVYSRQPQVWHGASDKEMAEVYNCFDLAISTTQGEGFGLTSLEAMACGVPCILPDHSAHGDWAKGAAWLVPCTAQNIGPPYVNVLGGVVDEKQFINALSAMYQFPEYRTQNSQAALERASEDRFTWATIGNRFVEEVVDKLLTPIDINTPVIQGTFGNAVH